MASAGSWPVTVVYVSSAERSVGESWSRSSSSDMVAVTRGWQP